MGMELFLPSLKLVHKNRGKVVLRPEPVLYFSGFPHGQGQQFLLSSHFHNRDQAKASGQMTGWLSGNFPSVQKPARD